MGLQIIKVSDYYKKIIGSSGVEIEWKVKNYEEVKSGQLLAYANFKINDLYNKKIPVYSDYNGYCKIVQEGMVDKLGDALGYILDKKEKESFPNIPMDSIDEFSGTHTILWEKIGGYKAIGIPLRHKNQDNLYLSASYKDGKMSVEINFVSKVFKLKKGDTISFKFSNGKILDFTVGTKPVTVLQQISFPEEDEENCDYRNVLLNEIGLTVFHYGTRKKYMNKVCFFLSSTDLWTFIKEPIVSYRLTFNSEGGASVDDVPHNLEMVPSVCQEVINDMFQVLTETVSKYNPAYAISNLKKEQKEDSVEVEFDYCYVYLMYDTNTGYYKIGMSNDPTYREGTLQSEKPTINLLAYHKYPSRKFASAIEAALHNVYKDCHVRGEWYKLPKEEVVIIKEGLK